jgi:hypothetical protein
MIRAAEKVTIASGPAELELCPVARRVRQAVFRTEVEAIVTHFRVNSETNVGAKRITIAIQNGREFKASSRAWNPP